MSRIHRIFAKTPEGKSAEAQATELMLRSEVKRLELALREANLALEKSENLRVEIVNELIRSAEIDKRKSEIDRYKTELQLSCRLLEVSQELETILMQNEILMKSRSMQITKPLRYLMNIVRHSRRMQFTIFK